MIVVDAHGMIAVLEPRPTGAAHSMDTDWYAVDRNGRVAHLSSGEEGAVPHAAHRQYWDELYEDLAIARVASMFPSPPFAEEVALEQAAEATQNPVEAKLLRAMLDGDEASRTVYEDWLEQQGRERESWRPQGSVYVVEDVPRSIAWYDLPHQWTGLLRFTNRDFLELFRSEHSDMLRELDGRLDLPDALAVTDLPQYIFAGYWSAGAIASAYVLDKAVEPHFVGLYEYACGFIGPYSKQATPRQPLLVDHLPEPLRGMLGRLRLSGISFATTEELDPEDFVSCQRYRDG